MGSGELAQRVARTPLAAMICAVLVSVVASSCYRPRPPALPAWLTEQRAYLCCNLHYERSDVSDANYYVGRTLAVGTPVKIREVTADHVRFRSGGVMLTLRRSQGLDRENGQRYFSRIFLREDPRPRIERMPELVRDAIASSRVERGMTREQVLMSVGYPPPDLTPTTAASVWRYWYDRHRSYEVRFGVEGQVEEVVTQAPLPGIDG